jgi:hypothetical protein
LFADLQAIPGVEVGATALLRLAVLGVVAPVLRRFGRVELDDRDALPVRRAVVPERNEARHRLGEFEHAFRQRRVVGTGVVAQPGAEHDDHHRDSS